MSFTDDERILNGIMKLSIITINYNNAEGLRKTLASVASQTFRDFEHIIVDGGSTDGSVEVIHEYEQSLASRLSPLASNLKWLSEPDSGIYNAMNKGIEIALGRRVVNAFNRSELVEDKNKGIKMADGEYLLFLNSGDYLVDADTLENVFEKAKDVDIIYGDRINVWKDGLERNRDSFPDHITGYFLYRGMISHQASFIKSDLFVKYGLYREDLKYGADWEFFLRTFLLYNCTYQHIYQNVVYFDCLGISSVAENNKEMWDERKRVFAETLPAFAEDYMLMEHYQEMLRGYDKRANQLGKIIVKPIRRLLKLLKK